MRTLTGFELHHLSIDEWRSYRSRLEAEREEVRTWYREIRAHRRPTPHETRRWMGRIDVVSEFIMRAEWEIDALS
ncbi:MAG: hypothetical protein R3C52_09160 [Hyphomonadaceae bacterium]